MQMVINAREKIKKGKGMRVQAPGTTILSSMVKESFTKRPTDQKPERGLTGVAQWVGHCPADKKVASSIPGQGTCLGCRPGPWLQMCERPLMDVSLLFLPPVLSL